MKIEVIIRPQTEIRNLNFDDYHQEDGVLTFEVGDLGNDIYNKILLIHAIVEQMLSDSEGIAEEDITEYDRTHLESEEPGLEIDAPYRDAHLLAEGIERILCSYMKIPWKEYQEAFDA